MKHLKKYIGALSLASTLGACERPDKDSDPVDTQVEETDNHTVDTDRDTIPDEDSDSPPITEEPGEIQGFQEMGLTLVKVALDPRLEHIDTMPPEGAAESWWNNPWVVLPDRNILAPGFIDQAACGEFVPILDPTAGSTVGCLEAKVNYQGLTFVASGENSTGDNFVVLQGVDRRGPEVVIFRENRNGDYVETDVAPGDRRTNGLFFLSGLPGADGLLLRTQFGVQAPMNQLCPFAIDAQGTMTVNPCLANNIYLSEAPYTFRNIGDSTLFILRGGPREEELGEVIRLNYTGGSLSAEVLTGFIPTDQGLFELQPGEVPQLGRYAPMSFVCFDNRITGEQRDVYEGIQLVSSSSLQEGPYCVIGSTRDVGPGFYMPSFPDVTGMEDRSYPLGLPGALMSEWYVSNPGDWYVREWDNLALAVATRDRAGNPRVFTAIIKTGGDDGGTTNQALRFVRGEATTGAFIQTEDMGLSFFSQALSSGPYPNIWDTPAGRPIPSPIYDAEKIYAGQFYSTYNLGRPTEGFANDLQVINPRTLTIATDGKLLVGTESSLPYPGREAPPTIVMWKRTREDACRVWTVYGENDLATQITVEMAFPDGTLENVTIMPTNAGKQVHHGRSMSGYVVGCEGSAPTENPLLISAGWNIQEVTYAQ